ncbi:hypothetical protein SteCoe_32083 [Stentor coeruleus]|uniref:Protein SPT2 homolog n=1 Tax=Stentor coeruleus TaxID=5963 RepID=A0A1R2B010_9CILI|nr:hypothetical protein SteCoe_32083 [Stentor coeruleus]
MSGFIHSDGLKKLNPRELPEENQISSRLQKFLNKIPSNQPSSKILAKISKPNEKHIERKPAPSQNTSSNKPKPRNDAYLKQLEYSRNYSAYINDYNSGKSRDDLFPESALDMIPKFQNIPKKSEKSADDGKALFDFLTKPKNQETKKKAKLKGKGLLQQNEIWCARCKKNHDPNFHFREKKPAPKPNQIPLKRQFNTEDNYKNTNEEYSDYEEDYYDDYSDEENDDFIVHDEDEETVKKMVRKVTGFDPSRYKHIDSLSTKGMEASADQILKEERISARIGSYEDDIELEKLKKKRKYF